MDKINFTDRKVDICRRAAGVCSAALAAVLMFAGMPAFAAKPKGKTRTSSLSTTEYLDKARSLFEAYRFDQALEQAANAKRTAKDEDDKAAAEELSDQIRLAENFLSRVERITILDSIAVPKADFFKAYKLPSSAGSLSDATALPVEGSVEDIECVFTNEGDNFKMWSEPDTTGYYRIMESNRLTDGKWSPAHAAPEKLGGGGNAAFPFMMADGVTLYYAADGDESMGGYDIFVANRDAQTGEYLQPQNIGMPYNSPFDDYMLAIDEENGVGWWATDRNLLEDQVTVYLFKTNDLRQNYDADADDLVEKARITDFKSTRDPETDYSELIETVSNIRPEKARKHDFIFPMDNGAVYTSLDDFSSNAGKTAMKRYLGSEKTYNENLTKLAGLRRQYSQKATDALKNSILKLEQWTENERESLAKLRSDVYKAERR